MSNRKWYEWMLTVVYFAMVALCVFLNFSAQHKESMATIIVNALMFVIVGIIFICAERGSFGPMNSIIKDLAQASEKIKMDAMNTHSYLWEPYHSSNIELFKNARLQEIFRDFLFDLNRDGAAANMYYRPNIDDYVNDDLIDDVMHRNELNQIPGMLTGLGILGTFIGLSLGLQHFNTGTTAEMTSSIEPLMNGIKVAFHTSIYGMVFSLTFNTIYKKKLFEAEAAVDDFIVAFKKYVLPNTTYDGMNQILMLQEAQITAINNLSNNLGEDMAQIFTPHLDRIESTIVDFENMATRSQMDGMSKVVEFFIDEMNKALSKTFWELNKSVEDMYETQKENASLMQEVLKTTGESAGNLDAVNRATEKLVSTLNRYSEAIQAVLDELKAVLDELQNTTTSMSNQSLTSEKVIEQEKNMLAEQQNLIMSIQTSISELSNNSTKSSADIKEAMMEMHDGMYLLRRTLEKQPAGTTTPVQPVIRRQ